MPLFRCSRCDRRLKVGDNLAGKRVRCPGCGMPNAVPREEYSTELSRTRGHLADDDDSLEIGEIANLEAQHTTPPLASNDQTVAGDDEAAITRKLTELLAAPQGRDEIGRLGSFRVLKILGHGGMGVVFQAEDVKLQRKVAIKAMLPSATASKSSKDRFLREARMMAKVEHPHIARIYQVDEDRGMPFLAMEFLKGEALSDCLKRQGRLPIPEVLRIGREIAEGLAAAHETGLIHRDIKPANIWIESPRRTIKILDFGLARPETAIEQIDGQYTQFGAIVGTPAYMAPEQARGDRVDSRTDLFSLGCVLYRMATGQMAFKGPDTMATLVAISTDTPESPRAVSGDVPEELDRLIMTLLAKEPGERVQTARAVGETLAAIERQFFVMPAITVPPIAKPVAAPTAPNAAAVTQIMPVLSSSSIVAKARSFATRRNLLIAAASLVVLVPLLWFAFRSRGTPQNPTPDPVVEPKTPTPPGPGRVNYALAFDGKAKVGPLPLSLELSKPFTIELTITTTGEQSTTYPLLALNRINVVAGKNWGFKLIGQKDGKFAHSLTTKAVSDVPTRIACVYNGADMRLFVNGVRMQSKEIEGDPPAEVRTTLELGYTGFKGILNELRISQIARYYNDYQPPDRFETDPDTLALYHFDEGYGEILKDSSGNGRDATIYGATWVAADGSAVVPKAPSDWAVSPFDAETAKEFQSAWAKKIGMSTEIVIPAGVRFAVIPPGRFLMGNDDNKSIESPRHEVSISQPFAIGVYEVTVGQFSKFVKATNYSMPPGAYVGATGSFNPAASWTNPGWNQTPDFPVTCVSWNDAQAYCAWLTQQKGGRKFRLPTEAEWEYACRAGSHAPFFFGTNPKLLDLYGHHGAISQNRAEQVGKYLPNPWGLFDVYGNVWEMCQDSHDGTSGYDAAPAVDPQGMKDGANRMWRGGGWTSAGYERYTRSDYRFNYFKTPPDYRFNGAGFRVVMELARAK